MIYIGIDPGASGGIAVLREDGSPCRVIAMPATEADIHRALDDMDLFSDSVPMAALEHVWSTPGQGGAFKFGRNVGHCQMALTAAKIPFDQVLPKAWQRAIGVAYPPGSTDTEKKNITKRRAQQLFPRLTITHAIADALLIAEYCRRSHRGTNGQEEGSAPPATAQAQSREVHPREEAGTRQSLTRPERQGGGRSPKAAAARAAAARRRRGGSADRAAQ